MPRRTLPSYLALRWMLRWGSAIALLVVPCVARASEPLRLDWDANYLRISGPQVPGDTIEIHYLEAYCRPGSTDRDWKQTVLGHQTRLVSRSPTGDSLRLECRLSDGVVVQHQITAADDEVDFRLSAHNPTSQASAAHWAQPCMRVDRFTGIPRGPQGQQDYLAKSFVFVDDQLQRMPLARWATVARYVPGQVWAAPGVDRNDVNPRPLSELALSSGLIGCFSADEQTILATAFEPYQELFQGVIICLHADFRVGGLAPGETKQIRGKLYLVPADVDALIARYERDFPEHAARAQ